ncbi:MAG TPA: hypothetical protein DCP63_05205, partial [Bacteroidetes bacterium]|nr:hypothetical protein [Bacteroidota bacterium]
GLLIETIRYRLASLDSLHSASGSKASLEAFQPSMTGEAIPMSISYAFKIKNAHPLGLFVGMNVAGSMSAKGRVSSDPEGIRFDADFDIKSLQWLDERTTFSMQASTLSFSFAGLDPSRVLQSLTADVHLAARAIELDSLLLNNVEVGVRQAGDSGRFSFASLIDSTVALELAGATKYDSGFMALDLEKCKVDFNSSYAIENIQPAPLRIGRDGLHIGSLWMRHEVEEIHASGTFAPNGASDLKFTVRDFLLTNIKSISNRIRESGAGVPFSGTVNAEVGFSGTFENPKLSLALSAHGVRYREIVLGQIVNRSSYADGALQLFAEFRSRPDDPSVAPDALVSGTIPFNISFTNAPPKALVGEMNLRVSANGFRLQLIEPFVSKVMTDLAGTIACDMKLTGLIESPSYEGSMTLRDVRLFFVPIGIQYIIDGTLSPRGRQIVLDNVSVSNIPQDRPDGKMTMSGAFTLDGIQIRDFDFKANGQLLVMKESSRRAGQNLYGDLFGATGPDGVTWRGTLARSFLSGTLLVKNADLVFPPMRQAQALPSNKIPVVLVDDRPAPQQDSLSVGGGPELLLVAAMDTAGLKAKSSVAVNNLQVNNPQPTRLAQANEGSAATFLDNIVHDLVVETQGITQIRFVFNNLTSEELFADIKGRAVFAKNGDQTRLTGEVELGNRSYYNSVFKKLDATGRINFTGNPFSPELDIVAKYEGTHRYDTTSASYAARTGAGATDPRYEADKVIVSLLITGTREQPKVKTELAYVVHGEIKQATGDVEADALAFLVTGSFRDELTQQQRGSFISTSMLGGLTSSILSGPLTDLLRKEFGIIRSIDVLYYGGNFGESADVRLTGEIGDAVIRLGGRVFNDINNTNVSLQIPMSAIMGSEKWRNLVLEAERRVEGVETVDQKRESKGLRLLYRITF